MSILLDPVQTEILAAFESGALTGGVEPQRIDTHISHVFLTPDLVYKLKRAVRLNFVDQSTCEARKALCEAELKINQRTAPELYRRVLAIHRDATGVLNLGGEGEIVDWLVEMRRFDGEGLLDAIAMRGRLTQDLAIGAARALGRLHADTAPVLNMGHAADYRRTIRELRHTEENAAHEVGLELADASRELLDALDAELSHIDPLLEARRREGKVRRGHGDAHLRNITLLDGSPVLFDALEFDDRMATTDVVYDFAFLSMDLKHRNLNDAANAAMNAWWDATGEDEEALALLPFFMSLRAAVRMAVATAAQAYEDAQSYRTLAKDLLEHKAPTLIAVGGLSGVGKSTVARKLAVASHGPCGARILRSDVIRKSGEASSKQLPQQSYAPEQRAAVYQVMIERVKTGLRAGASVIADATFQSAAQRRDIGKCAGEHPFAGIWLKAELDVRLSRIKYRPKGVSDADDAVARSQTEPDIVETDWFIADASGTHDDTLQNARRILLDCGVLDGEK